MQEVMPKTERPPTQQAQRHVIVCVDDEPAVLEALKRILYREPYEVFTVQTPWEALELVEERRVSVLIADQRMPGMMGTELLKTVGEVSPRTARVILTGYPETTSFTENVFQRLLTKPWDDLQLRRTIRQLLRESDRQEPYLPD